MDCTAILRLSVCVYFTFENIKKGLDCYSQTPFCCYLAVSLFCLCEAGRILGVV